VRIVSRDSCYTPINELFHVSFVSQSSNGEAKQHNKQAIIASDHTRHRRDGAAARDDNANQSDVDERSDESRINEASPTNGVAVSGSRDGVCAEDMDEEDDDLDLDEDMLLDDDDDDDMDSTVENNDGDTAGVGQGAVDDVIARQRRRRKRRRLLAKLRMKQERELIERELKAAAAAAAATSRRATGAAAGINMSLGDGRRSKVRGSSQRSDDDEEDQAIDFGMKKRRHSGSGSDDNELGGARGGGYSCGSDDDGSPASPIEQTEIKMQRPLGLLAQHGLSVKMGGQTQHHVQGAGAAGGIRPHHLQHAGGPLMPGQFHHFDRAPTDFEREMLQQAMQAHGAAVSLHQAAAVAAAAAAADKDGRLFGLGVPPPGMRVDFGNGPPMTPVSNTAPLSLMDRRFMPSPPPNGPATPLGCGGQDPNKMQTNGAGSPGAHHWTFEEQFKQVRGRLNTCKVYSLSLTYNASFKWYKDVRAI